MSDKTELIKDILKKEEIVGILVSAKKLLYAVVCKEKNCKINQQP